METTPAMKMRSKLIVAAVVLLAVFLIGFVPQYLESRRLQDQVEGSAQRFQSLERRLQMAELRDVLALAYLETNRKNYGTARQHTSEFFARAGEIAQQTADPQLRATLERALQQRDEITAGLTAGEGAVRDTVESLFQEVHTATRQVQ
jgi:hypothetical protein